MAAWERYESKRNDLADKLAGAEKELQDIKKVSRWPSTFHQAFGSRFLLKIKIVSRDFYTRLRLAKVAGRDWYGGRS
jgi:hypothetical protein